MARPSFGKSSAELQKETLLMLRKKTVRVAWWLKCITSKK
jgi:hypothetical protein